MTGFYEGTGGAVEPVPHDLDFHEDVTIVTPTDGQILVYDAGQSQWVNQDGSSASFFPLEDLTNATITAPQDGQALVYQAGIWVNADIGTGGGTETLAGLLDTTITDPTNGDSLVFEGGFWVNATQASTTPNPLVVGNGADGTNAVVIVNSGSNVDSDLATIAFQQNGTDKFYIQSKTESPDVDPSFVIGSVSGTPAIEIQTDNRVSINGGPATDAELTVTGDTLVSGVFYGGAVNTPVLSASLGVVGDNQAINPGFELTVNGEAWFRDGIVVDGPALIAGASFTTADVQSAPSSGNSITNKTYVDGLNSNNVKTSGNQTINGDKVFTGIVDCSSGGLILAPVTQTSFIPTSPNRFPIVQGGFGVLSVADYSIPTAREIQDQIDARIDLLATAVITELRTKVRTALVQIADITNASPPQVLEIEALLDSLGIE